MKNNKEGNYTQKNGLERKPKKENLVKEKK